MILAKTVKGYGFGEAGEGKNITHQQKKLNEDELFYLSGRFGLNLPKEPIQSISLVRPPDDSPEMKYLKAVARRWAAICRSASRNRLN